VQQTAQQEANLNMAAAINNDAMPGSREEFIELGAEIMKRSHCDTKSRSFETRWHSHFQVAPFVISVTWNMLIERANEETQNRYKYAKPVHLLWACLFLKVYKEEAILTGMCGGVDEDTFRKWVWFFVDEMSDLEYDVVSTMFSTIYYLCFYDVSNSYCHIFCQILWENRKIGDKGRDCLIDYDGVDFITTRQGKIPKAFYSHKHNGPGLRYSVGTCIETGDIVHIDGPHPPGDWNDLTIFRVYLKPWLDVGERINADAGYSGDDPECVVSQGGIRYMETPGRKMARGLLRKRHETVNERLKQFHVLSGRFSHDNLKIAVASVRVRS
jgi:hypothetical protein